MRLVADIHQRKAEMARHSDAFIALPGGYGTLEELLEVITWAQLGSFHHKPVHLRHDVRSVATDPASCRCEVWVGIEWLKSSKFQKRIARNICDKLAHRAKEVLEVAGKEITSAMPVELAD